MLKDTFSGNHKVDSGTLNFKLTLTPSGSTTLNGPITLSFGGPFQSQGTGKLPKSAFTVSASLLGQTGTLGLVSLGDRGFVTISGTGYQLPASTYQKLASSYSSLATPIGSNGAANSLSKLGIDPMRWLRNPTVAGTETIEGSETTHIKAGVDVAKLLADLNTFLGKAGSLGIPKAGNIPASIPAATQQKIANAVKNPSFEVWTGKSDKMLRRLLLRLMLPVTGQLSSQLGGLRAADIALTVQYGSLNQPQTITAPATVRPFNEFQAKIQQLFQGLRSGLAGAGGGSTGAPSGGAPTGAPSQKIQLYSQCIQSAAGDITKMQRCAGLLQK